VNTNEVGKMQCKLWTSRQSGMTKVLLGNLVIDVPDDGADDHGWREDKFW